jgi:hypothetical protein
MTTRTHDPDTSLSETLTRAARGLPADTVAVRELLERVGESGMLLFAVFLTLPFLVPVSVPGVSTVFGLLIILIGIGVTANRLPWLPARLLEKRVSSGPLSKALEQGARLVARIEKLLHPRWGVLVRSAAAGRFNGAVLVFAGVLLMAPFGLVPFSNTLPGLAILCLALGMLEQDGLFVFFGYVLTIATVVYFGFLIWAAYKAGTAIFGG